jgi:hypothetical protein
MWLTSSLQLPLKLANFSLSLLPASDTLSQPVMAITVDWSNTLINLARSELTHTFEGFVVELVVLQLVLLAFFGFGDVDVALFDLRVELSTLSAKYCGLYHGQSYQGDWGLHSLLARLVDLIDQ